jgi:predicted RNA methylase
MLTSASAAPAAATLPLFLPQATPDKVSGLIHAATILAQLLGQGRAVDSRALRSAVETAFCGTDAEGVWVWKDAYEALEAAQVMFLRKFGSAMRTRAGSAAAMLDMLTRLAGRLPTQTRRSEESENFQQFSTPIALGFAASEAAALTPADLVLEPSAGTGLLAIFAEFAKARLALNEIADTRAGLLERLFRGIAVTRHNAEQIHDRLDPAIRPSVVLMNPPFSASPHIEGRFAEAAIRHLSSALARLADGGRLVAITGRNAGPDQPAWREAFVRLQEKARIVFTAAIAGQAYVRHGTNIETRLTVIDRIPAEDPRAFPPSPGMAADAAQLLDWVFRHVPARQPIAAPSFPIAPTMFPPRAVTSARPKASAPQLTLVKRPAAVPDIVELTFETCAWTPGATRFTASLYEGYALQSMRIPDARPQPPRRTGAVPAAASPLCRPRQ